MKKRIFRALCVFLLLGSMSLPAFADTGPKPSVHITVEGLNGRTCYGTLMAIQSQYGPHTAAKPGEWLGIPTDASPEEIEAWYAFQASSERREFEYFLRQVWDVSDGSFAWTYYPPDPFVVVLWFPDTKTIVTSEWEGQYAFDSYFTMDLTGAQMTDVDYYTNVMLTKSYDYTWELISLAARVVITIALELVVAWLFRLRTKRALAVILPVNLVTQIALNAALNWRAYVSGHGYIFFPYLLMELGVLAVEIAAYWRLLPRDEAGKRPAKLACRYAFTANLISFAVGWVLALVIPGIF